MNKKNKPLFHSNSRGAPGRGWLDFISQVNYFAWKLTFQKREVFLRNRWNHWSKIQVVRFVGHGVDGWRQPFYPPGHPVITRRKRMVVVASWKVRLWALLFMFSTWVFHWFWFEFHRICRVDSNGTSAVLDVKWHFTFEVFILSVQIVRAHSLMSNESGNNSKDEQNDSGGESIGKTKRGVLVKQFSMNSYN